VPPKKKRRRPNAGPPPAPAAKRTEESAEAPERKPKPKLRAGEPVPPSYKGVLIRSVIVAVLFYPVLVYIAGEKPGSAAVVSLIAFLLMLPFGLLLDRVRYRTQRRRYEARRAGRAS
jgi:hypothetical protein